MCSSDLALAVPINLRGWFPTETLRNFITTVRPFIDPALGDYTFPEIAQESMAKITGGLGGGFPF